MTEKILVMDLNDYNVLTIYADGMIDIQSFVTLSDGSRDFADGDYIYLDKESTIKLIRYCKSVMDISV